MPGNLGLYQKSISDEFKVCQNRVRNIIGEAHWGEEGRYKEIILMNILRRFLPKYISVGTGFVMKSENVMTKQIDIIIYDNRFPLIFSEGDFVILSAENVLGIIEVKTKIRLDQLDSVIDKATENGRIIEKNIFNGIFAYDNGFKLTDESARSRAKLENALRRSNGYINHISFGENFFIRYWNEGNPRLGTTDACYSIYRIEGYSFPYFISNLIEAACKRSLKTEMDSGYFDIREFTQFLYTIEGTKENFRICNFEL